MVAKLFSLEEANRLLPLVRSITRDAVRRYHAAKRGIRAWEWLRAQRRSGHPVEQGDLDRRDSRIAGHLEELQRLTEELDALGCRLRDFERGVVDFPAACLDDDPFVYYCWALGERRITHWHGEQEGFSERRLVGASPA